MRLQTFFALACLFLSVGASAANGGAFDCRGSEPYFELNVQAGRMTFFEVGGPDAGTSFNVLTRTSMKGDQITVKATSVPGVRAVITSASKVGQKCGEGLGPVDKPYHLRLDLPGRSLQGCCVPAR